MGQRSDHYVGILAWDVSRNLLRTSKDGCYFYFTLERLIMKFLLHMENLC